MPFTDDQRSGLPRSVFAAAWISEARSGRSASSRTSVTIALIRTPRAVQRPWLSAERAVDGDFVESVLENGELLIVELREEQLRDPAQVDGSGLGEARHAGVGQRDDDAACVRIGVGSPDEAFLDQPGDPPGH